MIIRKIIGLFILLFVIIFLHGFIFIWPPSCFLTIPIIILIYGFLFIYVPLYLLTIAILLLYIINFIWPDIKQLQKLTKEDFKKLTIRDLW